MGICRLTDIADTSIKMRHELVGILPRLTSFACRLTGSRDDGADLVQSACQRALESVHQWRPDARLDSWMYRIIHNLWIDGLRKQKGRRTWSLDGLQDSGPSVDGRTTVDARLMLQSVRRVIKQLPQEQRDVLELIVVDGRSYRDTAIQLGVPVGTVMSRLARARGKLKTEIGWPISALLLAVALGVRTEDEALADEASDRSLADLSFAPVAELDRTTRAAQATDLGFAKTVVVLAYVLGWMQEQRGIIETDDQVDAQTLDSLTAYLIGDEQPGSPHADTLGRAPGDWTGSGMAAAAAGSTSEAPSGEPQGALPALESLDAQGAEENRDPAFDAAAAAISGDADRHAAASADQEQPIVGSLGDETLKEHMDEALAGKNDTPSLLRSVDAAAGFAAAGGHQIAGTAGTFQLQSSNSQTGLIGTAGSELLTARGEFHDGNQILIGSAADDVLTGSEGDDALYGGDGDDVLSGGSGQDLVFGGDGDDLLSGGDPAGPVPDLPESIRQDIIARVAAPTAQDDSGDGSPESENLPQQPVITETETAEAETAETAAPEAATTETTTVDSVAAGSDPQTGTAEQTADEQASNSEDGDEIPPEQDPEHQASNSQGASESPPQQNSPQQDPEVIAPGQDPEQHASDGEGAEEASPGPTNEDAQSDDHPAPPAGTEAVQGQTQDDDPPQAQVPDDAPPAEAAPTEDSGGQDPAEANTSAPNDGGIDQVINDPNDDSAQHWWGYDDFLFGGHGNDLIWGGKGNDWLFGGQGRDQLHGGDDDDLIFGGTEDDRIWGGQGDDIVVGGGGHDQAYFDGDRGEFLVSGSNQDYVTVTDLRAGSPSGWDFLIEVETLEFNDGSYATADLVQEYQAWVSDRLLGEPETDSGDPIALGDVVDSDADDVGPDGPGDSGGTHEPAQDGQAAPAVGPAGNSDPLPSVDQIVEETGSAVQVM